MKTTKVCMEYHGKPCVIIFDCINDKTDGNYLHVAFDVLQHWYAKKLKSGHVFYRGQHRVVVWFQGDLEQRQRQLSLFPLEVS